MMSLGDGNANFGRSVPNEDLDIAVIPCSCTIYVFRDSVILYDICSIVIAFCVLY